MGNHLMTVLTEEAVLSAIFVETVTAGDIAVSVSPILARHFVLITARKYVTGFQSLLMSVTAVS